MSTDIATSGNYQWQPCFVDPWRGVAHFDGLTIEADPITSARPNRVLPCIEDEQVLFCRTFRAILQAEDIAAAGKTAIDLGTGSGVFALYAAKLRMNVTGVDCCQRSIQFADYNERMARKPDPAMGACQFTQVRHWNDLLTTSSDPADFVFLNAPFSPQASSVILPKCAHGGLLGQNAFRSALPLAHGLLREEGRLFAVQLLLTDSRGRPQIDLVAETGSHQKWSRIRIFPILDTPTIPASDFLRQQYRSFDRQAVLNPADAEGKYFSYVFIEFTKDSGSAVSPRIDINCKLPLQNVPSWTWPERASWHRAVFENSISESVAPEEDAPPRSTLPSVSLFLERAHPPLRIASAQSAQDSKALSKLTPIQSILHQWIRINGLLDPKVSASRAAFDCIMVEAAPWHAAQRRLDLRTETVLWKGGEVIAETSQNSTPVARALARILKEIENIYDKKRSVFRHPEIEAEGHKKGHLWRPAVLFRYQEDDPQFLTKCELDADLCGPLTPDYTLADDCRVTSTVASYLHPLKDFKAGETNPTTRPLDDCLAAALHAYTAILRQEGILGFHPSICYFYSFPLPAAQPNSQSGTSGTVYVYGWSSKEWTPDHETVLCDLTKAASLQYEKKYSDAARKEVSRLVRNRIIESAAHESRKILYAVQQGLTHEAASLLRDYLSLHLELTPVGETFQTALDQFLGTPVESIKELAECGYIYWHICSREWNANQLSSEQFDKWRTEARKLISVTLKQKPTVPVPSGSRYKKMWVHFIAAFLAALQNCIIHSTKGSRARARIVISIQSLWIQIENSYQSSATYKQDIAPYQRKQEKADLSGDAAAFGTEQVLSYHARHLQPDIEIGSTSRFIQKQRIDSDTSDINYHSWITSVPLPTLAHYRNYD